MECNNYEFCVGDEVETVDGMVGKIVSICHCERCAERGFFEPKWETSDGEYSDYITVNQANRGFPYYRRIGKYVWNHDTDEEKSTKNILQKKDKEMKEIKLTIDGKEIQLTDEQLKMLGIDPEKKKKNPFDRVAEDEVYFQIGIDGDVFPLYEYGTTADEDSVLCVNYFNDKQFAKQVALHQLLYRKLLKYSYDNEFEDEEWNGTTMHAYIIYNFTRKDYDIRWTRNEKEPGTVYFKTPTRATAALNEVVMPFVKEHPDFVW